MAIVTNGGKFVLRDGKVGTGQGCCCGCGRCVVPPHDMDTNGGTIRIRDSYAEPRWRTQAECERCRMCVESLATECNGDCPGGSGPLEPLVTLGFSADCGSGAAGTVKIGCGAVLSATLTSGGSGYATETISEPTLTATAPGGTGGVLSINGYSKLVGGTFGGYYVPTGITVTSGGSGYTDNAQVTLSLGTDDEWAPSSGTPNIRIRTGINPPGDDWTLTVYSTDGINLSAGVGLALSITLTPIEGVDGYFEATAVTITNGGTGYEAGESIIATVPPDGDFGETAFLITDVGQDGAVTGLSIDFPGQHQGVDTGVISSVVITSNRPARKRTVEVCEVAVSIVQESPSAGTGATITATVDSTPASPNFGKVTGLTVTSGGSGYVALCERKTAVGSCDECEPPATCEETGGCPCGTWVVDSDQTACECCKWTNPDWGVALMNLVDSDGEPIEYMDQEVECEKLRDKMLLIRSHFEAAGWTVTLEENWCPPNVLDVWGNVYPFLDPENPCACGFLFRAECESCNRAYPAHIWTPPFDIFIGQLEARPFDLSQWVAIPIEDWEHEVPAFSGTQFSDVMSIWPYDGFARIVYCEYAPGGVTVYKDPLESVVPVFEFTKRGHPLASLLTYGASRTESNGVPTDPLYHGGGLIPGYYSRGIVYYTTPTDGTIYIPKCGVEITERARCVRYSGNAMEGNIQVLDDTWASCCAECPPGYTCFFAGDPLHFTLIGDNPLP